MRTIWKHFCNSNTLLYFFLLVVKFSSCAEVDAVYAGWREGRRQECGGSTCSHPPELAIRYPLPLPTHHHQIPSDWPHLSNPLSQSTAGIVWTSHGLRPSSRHPHANTAGAGCRALGDGRWQRPGAIYIYTPSCYNDNMWWQSSTTPPDQIEKIASSLIWRTPLETLDLTSMLNCSCNVVAKSWTHYK